MAFFRRITSLAARLAVILLLVALALPATPAMAQSDEDSAQTERDRDFVTRFLEEHLSGAGRTITLIGFKGALSSRATFETLSIADEDGAWITLRDGAIQWNRSALLARRVEVAELSAAEIEFTRLPKGDEEKTKAEAKEFNLPTLPVGVHIDDISADHVIIGEEVFGEAAEVSVHGAMALSGGSGEARLNIIRQDGKQGDFRLHAAFSNKTRVLTTDLTLDEAEDGILANMIGLHGRPSLRATIKGEGPLSDFGADITLATDGEPRVTGQVGISAQPAEDDQPAGTGFRLRLSGDIAALVPEKHRAFFGTDSQLLVEGRHGDDGRLAVPVMLIDTDALNLSGSFALNSEGAPQSAALLMTLGEDAGATETPVRLPGGKGDSQVESGRLELDYDARSGEGWHLKGHLDGFTQPGMAIGTVDLNGAGKVLLEGDSLVGLSGALGFAAGGILPDDPNLAEAIGDAITGETRFDWEPKNALELAELIVRGDDYRLTGDILIGDVGSGLPISGHLEADHKDLSRLSGLADRPLSGTTRAEVSGYITLLNRAFSAEARLIGQDITLDQPQIDRLLAGQSIIAADAKRDEEGIELSSLTIDNTHLTADASGTISSEDADLKAKMRLSSLARLDDSMGGELTANAAVTGPSGARKLVVNGHAVDLSLGIEAVDAALRGETNLDISALESDSGVRVEKLHLGNPQLAIDGDGNLVPGEMDATITLAMNDLAALGKGWAGSISGQGRLEDKTDGLHFALDGAGRGLAFGDPRLDGMLKGETRLDVEGVQDGDEIRISTGHIGNDQFSGDLSGVYLPGSSDISAAIRLPNLQVMGAGYGGSAELDANLTEDGKTRLIRIDGVTHDLALGAAGANAALAGATKLTIEASETDSVITLDKALIDNPRLHAEAEGSIGGGETDLGAKLRADSLAFLGRGLRGAVSIEGRLQDDGQQQKVTASGQATGLGVGIAEADQLLAGTTRLDLDASRSADQIEIRKFDVANDQASLSASGNLDSTIRVNARVANLGLVRREFPGPASVEGSLRRAGNQIGVDLAARGPGGTDARIAGTVQPDFQMLDLNITGNSEAAIANPFLRVRSIEGPVNLALAVRGKPGLEALSGKISLPNARLSDPKLGYRVDHLRLDAQFSNGRIAVDGGGDVAAGGHIGIGGAVTLTGAQPLDFTVDVNDVVVRDPNLYTTKANGQLSISGALAAGPLIAGRIQLSDTEIRIPSTGLGGAKAIPPIHHVNDTRPPRATRAKAGLSAWPSEDSTAAGMGGPAATPPANPARLDLLIEAPNQIFIRGRGVDAELGGQLRLTGHANNVIPIGMFELIRGRVDLLGKRFDLTEGLLEMQGSMIPIIRLVAETVQNDITTRITIDGDASDPEITFSSDPDMPQEEVLSQLLFGRGLDKITPLQAAQLANAVAVLAGRAGEGIVGQLRKSVGLDDLDLATDDEGNVTVRAGKYLSENIYTDVAVGADGTSTIEINLDLTSEVTARGSVNSDGASAIGLFYERDF